MKFQRNSEFNDLCIITEHPNPKMVKTAYQIIPLNNDAFSLHKNYVKKIFGKKSDFLSEYEDESSHIIFNISWIVRKDPSNPKYYNFNIKDFSLHDEDEEA